MYLNQGKLLTSVSLLMMASASITAQAAETNGAVLEELVVTAQKKSENIQDVPISIVAVTGDDVADLHAVTLEGLQNTIPNVSIGPFSNTPNNAVFTIRGIGVIEPDPYAGNTVAVVVDGVPQYFSIGALVDLYDIDRIEVLRGPQGTLFGANTTGGVINIINKQPEEEFGGQLDFSYGDWKHLTIGGVVTGAITETVSARLSISHDERQGWVTNVVDGSDMGSRDVTIIRGAVKITPSDNFEMTLTGEYDIARNGSPVVIAGNLPGESEYVPEGFRNMYASPCAPAGSVCDAPDNFLSANNSVPNLSHMDTYRATLNMKFSNTGLGDITSITGYKKFDLFEYTDQDGTPVTLIDTRRTTEGWQFSQELRTDFEASDIVRMTVGGLFMKTHFNHEQDLRIDFAGGATYDFVNDTVTKGFPGLFQLNLQDQDNWSGSFFAQSYIDVTEDITIQAGVRYTHEETEMEASTLTTFAPGGVTTFDGVAPDGTPNLLISNVAPPREKSSWDNIGWKIGIDYKATADSLLYAYWARGFKSGGYTGRIGIAQDVGPYGPEKVDTFEIGYKADFLENRLRTNIAAFYTNYRDMQLAQIYFVGSGANLVQGNTIINAASSRIMGVEIDATAIPAEGLTLTGSIAYTDAEYRDFSFLLPDSSTRDLSGQRLQNSPKWSGAAAVSYEFPVSDNGTARIKVQYTYTGEKLLTSIVDTPRATIKAVSLVNANMDWMPLDDQFTISLWARNLLDKRYINSVFDAPGTLGLVNYAPPREYGVSFKAPF